MTDKLFELTGRPGRGIHGKPTGGIADDRTGLQRRHGKESDGENGHGHKDFDQGEACGGIAWPHGCSGLLAI
ncbi:hypothetical protein DESC_120044 [Desulfosarcina cetonica]|nr:hypothetical protein DESC_120044 [Desulfosarcina cetonica]